MKDSYMKLQALKAAAEGRPTFLKPGEAIEKAIARLMRKRPEPSRRFPDLTVCRSTAEYIERFESLNHLIPSGQGAHLTEPIIWVSEDEAEILEDTE